MIARSQPRVQRARQDGHAEPWHPFTGSARKAVRTFVRGMFTLLHRARVIGAANVPATGPVLLLPNHPTYYDPFLVGMPLDRPIHYMTWDAILRVPVVGRVVTRLGAFPVRLDSADWSALRRTTEVLRGGGVVCIFMEGGRSHGRGLDPPKEGAALLAIDVGATVVPVALSGAFRCWPRTQRLPVPGHPIRVEFLEPIRPARIAGRSRRARARALTAIAALRLEEALDRGLAATDGRGLAAAERLEARGWPARELIAEAPAS